MIHYSVMLNECLNGLNIKEDGIYVDCTLGLAGHSSEILKKLTTGHLYAFDQDKEAIKISEKKLNEISKNFTIIHSNFINLKSELNKLGIDSVDGILMDIGVSSMQLDNRERGFSFHDDAYLDMRMNQEQKLDATYIVNNYSLEQLTNIIRTYGEEKFAFSIAKNIIKVREENEINSTLQLVEIIKSSMPAKEMRKKHPAKKTFQALRIAVNEELEVFKSTLYQAIELLNENGRLVVLTFHSLEDRIAKDIFNEFGKAPQTDKRILFPEEFIPKIKLLTRKPVVASNEENEENSRSHSAKLRIIEKR